MTLKNKRKVISKGLVAPYPIFQEKEYSKLLLDLIREIERLVYQELLNETLLQSYKSFVRRDELDEDLDKSVEIAVGLFLATKINTFVNKLLGIASKIDTFTRNAFFYAVKNLIGDRESDRGLRLHILTLLNMWIGNNGRNIRAMPNLIIWQVATEITRASSNLSSLSELKTSIGEIFTKNKNLASVRSRTEVSYIYAQIMKAMYLYYGLDYYEWITRLDERVRHSHSVMHGKDCSWLSSETYKDNINDSKWKQRSSIGGVQKHVGHDYNCRCFARAIMISYM